MSLDSVMLKNKHSFESFSHLGESFGKGLCKSFCENLYENLFENLGVATPTFLDFCSGIGGGRLGLGVGGV